MSSDHEHAAPEGQDTRGDTGAAIRSPTARAPSHAERCRTLVATARTAALSSIARDPAGYPYGSLVSVAEGADGQPLLLLSSLAEHTANLAERPEASLLVTAPASPKEPLAAARVTLLGPCRRAPEDAVEAARTAFLKAHPGSAAIAALRDFAFYQLDVVAIRYIGGFGQMSWVAAEDYRRAEPDPLAGAAPGILSHMNQDHGDALLAYAKGLCGIPGASAAVMTAVDRYGFEIGVTTEEGARDARLAWDAPLTHTTEVRRALIKLLAVARDASSHSAENEPERAGTT